MFFTILLGIHIIAATAWLGGSIFFLLVLRPAFKGRNAGEITAAIGALFREVSEISLWVVIGTGTLLALDRLLLANLESAYIAVLILKITLVLWMVLIALNLWERVTRGRRTSATASQTAGMPSRVLRLMGSTNMQLGLGIVVLFLAELLRVIYNRSL